MKIAIIGCAKRKRRGRYPAKDLYISPRFRMAWQYAEKNFTRIYILSAKYGLLPPARRIANYDRTLKRMTANERRAWARKVAAQIERQLTKNSELHFYCGRAYVEHIPPLLPGWTVHTPLRGLGMGKCMQWFKVHA